MIDQRRDDLDLSGRLHRRQIVRPAVAMLATSAVAVLGVVGLVMTTSTSRFDPSLTRALPTLAASWHPSAAAAVSINAAETLTRVNAPSHGFGDGPATRAQNKGLPTAGDEGFWLSRQDLIGSTAGPIAIGDRISFAPSAGTESRIFEVIELKPLRDTALEAAAAPDHVAASPTDGAILTMVVGRQIAVEQGRPPRVIRFLMEGAPAISTQTSATPPAPPKTL